MSWGYSYAEGTLRVRHMTASELADELDRARDDLEARETELVATTLARVADALRSPIEGV